MRSKWELAEISAEGFDELSFVKNEAKLSDFLYFSVYLALSISLSCSLCVLLYT